VAVLLSTLCACGGEEQEQENDPPDRRQNVTGSYALSGTSRASEPEGPTSHPMEESLRIANDGATGSRLLLTFERWGCDLPARMDGDTRFLVEPSFCMLQPNSGCTAFIDYSGGRGSRSSSEAPLQVSLEGRFFVECEGGSEIITDVFFDLTGPRTGE
jgi:hypothetical protein